MKEYTKNAAKDFGSGAMNMLRLLASPIAVAIMWFVGLSVWMASVDRIGFILVMSFYGVAFTIYMVGCALTNSWKPWKQL